MRISTLENVTRVTVVGPSGVLLDKYNTWDGVELHLQDDGRTLKVFPVTNGRVAK